MMLKRQQIYCACMMFGLLLGHGLVQANWPEFRGPGGMGLASQDLPLRWSESENVKWKTVIPHRGWSTPVVMDGLVWLTTATRQGHDFYVIAVKADSGEVCLNKRIFHCADPEPLGNPVNCYASPSPVIEPGRVYVHFGSYGTACVDVNTYQVRWQRTDLPCRHFRGPGSSPVLFEDLLILTMDGVDLQYLVALDKRTGNTVWKTERTAHWNDLDKNGQPKAEGDLRKAYSTPLLIEVDGEPQMLSVGAKALYGYDPRTGCELWRVNTQGFSGAARPVYARGVAYMINGFGRTELLAIRVNGSGNVTDTHVLWQDRKMVPRTPSPLLVDDLLFTVNDTGSAKCWEAPTGQELWKERLGGHYAASPLYAQGRVYCFSQEGKTTVFKAARDYEVLATNTLDAGMMASAAVSGSMLFLRTRTHLYCIKADGEGD